MDANIKVTIDVTKPIEGFLEVMSELMRFAMRKQSESVPAKKPEVNKVSEPEATTPTPVEQEATFDSIFGDDEPSMRADDPASTQVDLNTVQSKVAELIRQGKKPQVADALKKMGVTGYSQLRGQDLTDFYNEIQKL